jgi:hypothetical protein
MSELVNNNKSSQLYGMWSDQQSEVYGIWIYSTPDGREIEVTSVSEDPEFKLTLFPDKKLLGPVEKMIRCVSRNGALE